MDASTLHGVTSSRVTATTRDDAFPVDVMLLLVQRILDNVELKSNGTFLDKTYCAVLYSASYVHQKKNEINT